MPEKGKVRGNSGGVAAGTDVQIVRYTGVLGETQTEPSHRWFPPTCPSEKLELNSFTRQKRK